MPSMVPFLRLPVLHRELTPPSSVEDHVPQTDIPLFLWPGLPGMPESGCWSPEYPFSPREAQVCLADMQAMGDAALSGVPLQALAARDASPAAARSAAEMEELADFARTGARDAPEGISPATLDLARRAAQKALLWAWLLEERALELRALAQTYAQGAAHLVDSLGVEHEERDAMPALAALGTHMDAHLAEVPDLLPPWRSVLENAAVFLPAHARIVADNVNMRGELRDLLNCAPASDGGLIAEAPLWRALGRTAPRPGCPWQERVFRFVLREER